MTTELVLAPESPPMPTLFGTDNPDEIIASAAAKATALAKVIDDKHLYTMISDRKFVQVEGWTLLGSLMGCFPVCVWSRRVTEGDDGWEARVEVRTLDDRCIGAAEAQCTRSESTWARRNDYALRSMAQTRATSKAMRLPLGFIMALAGYEATPADEMPKDGDGEEYVAPKRNPGRVPAPTRRTFDAAPVRAQEGQQSPVSAARDGRPTDKQLGMVRALRAGLHWDEGEFMSRVEKKFEKKYEDMANDWRDISSIIDWLKEEQQKLPPE